MTSLRLMGLAATSLAVLAFASASAHASIPEGWYVGANTDLVFQEDSDITRSGADTSAEYKTGWGLSGYAGYAYGNGLRTEGELTYRHSEVDEMDGYTDRQSDGGIHNWSLMGNFLYDIDTNTRFTPYVGFGLGVAHVSADNDRPLNGSGDYLDDDAYAFAYQGIAGVAYKLEGNWDFIADYRYYRTTDVDLKASNGNKYKLDNGSHNLMLGVRYLFDTPAPKAPAPAPEILAPKPAAAPAPVVQPAPAAAAPVVAPVPQNYIVFFDFDKSNLTEEAKRIIAAAAEDYKGGSYVRLVVTGYTDTMGTDRYNQKLSERRGAIVKKEFARLGVPMDNVSASGRGQNDLMVPTADEVREAQNRRAEIVLEK